MTDHPLTDEMCDDLSGWPLSEISDDYAEWSKQDMRDAADWQLEQVIEWLRSIPSRQYAHPWAWPVEMDKDELITDLKKSMRPQQQEDN